MKRTSLALTTTTLLASGAVVVAVAAAGTASTSQRTQSHRLSFTAHALSSVQVGKNHLIEGDKAVKAGRTIGYTANSCTFDFAAGTAHCLVTLARPQGQLRARATIDAQSGASTGRIVGGTGAYRGAKGTLTGQQGTNRNTVRLILHWTD